MRGRPKLPEGEKKVYQRIAIYKSTHERLKKQCEESGNNIVDYLDALI